MAAVQAPAPAVCWSTVFRARHLAATTIGRVLKEDGTPPLDAETVEATDAEGGSKHIVTAKYPNHVWHVDLTTVSTVGGFWVPWWPFTLPQVWPFCWWVAVILDHFSRRVIAAAIFKRPPTAAQVIAFLRRTMRSARARPKFLVSDKGPQFWCEELKQWCRRRGIRPRFGAIGKHGSIALIERFIRSMKEEGLRRVLLPLGRRDFRRELDLYLAWYNGHRPHSALGGATPDERYFSRRPANHTPRYEPRSQWQRGSPCAGPQTLIKGQPGVHLQLAVTFEAGRKHLPVVTLRRAA
ncbi:MAG: DDE-type integrase/transposase/recombinase [Phycisphaerae bacterium]